MFQTIEEVIDMLAVQMSTSASALSSEGQESAVNTALQELGWTLPMKSQDQDFWLTKRSVRHACFILWVASAHKFKYKQVNLQNRFEHYDKLLKSMDAEYGAAISANLSLFANVESYKMFGSVVGAGFRYDGIGRDITYEDLTRYINVGE